jgi:hypothetical protein
MRPDWGYYGTYDESAHPDLWNGVVGYWAPCLGPTGLRLHDVSRWNNWGTLTNMDAASDWVIDGGQYALDFDGSNDNILSGSVFSLANAVTISAWIWQNNKTSDRVIVDKGNTQNNFMLFTRNDTLVLRGASVTELSGVYTTTSQWSHVAGTIYGTTGVVYANGVMLATGTVAAVGNTENVLTIGKYGHTSGGFFSGSLSDLTIYNSALTPNKIRLLYNLGRGGMLQRKPRRRHYMQQAGFRAHYATQRNAQLIGGGLR